MARPYTYTYRVVSSNGAGRHSEHKSLPKARAAMVETARAWPGDFFEIERVRHLHGVGRQYQMREGHRWVDWDPSRDHKVRKPDWYAMALKGVSRG